MDTEMMTERLFPLLITGDRAATRSVVESMIQEGVTPEQLTQDAYWPICILCELLGCYAFLNHRFNDTAGRSSITSDQKREQSFSHHLGIHLYAPSLVPVLRHS